MSVLLLFMFACVLHYLLHLDNVAKAFAYGCVVFVASIALSGLTLLRVGAGCCNGHCRITGNRGSVARYCVCARSGSCCLRLLLLLLLLMIGTVKVIGGIAATNWARAIRLQKLKIKLVAAIAGRCQ